MTFNDLQKEISQYVYTEDDGMAKIALASIIATRLKLGDPIWLLLIGPSSSGKSQILRPLALTDNKFIHRVDDLTENTFLSGIRTKEDSPDISLLKRIGANGILVISDFTVIFSKSPESRAAILAQLRMVYDGEMVKYSGNKSEPISWKGQLGLLAGSTPSIYNHFDEVADMGERFIYYRMKAYDVEQATRKSLQRTIYGRELDDKLSNTYADYLKKAVEKTLDIEIPPISIPVYERIIQIAMFAANLRTPTHYDRFQKAIDRVPVPEMPMRVALQLSAIARGLSVIKYHDTDSFDLDEQDIRYIEWCAYSLANEERRACLRVFANMPYEDSIATQTIADKIGLSTEVIKMNLQHLTAISIVRRDGDSNSLKWQLASKTIWETVRQLENIEGYERIVERGVSAEEVDETEEQINKAYNDF